MTTLVPMQPAAFGAFAEASVAQYADDNVLACRWPVADAPARARAEFDRLLPQGLATPGHFIYDIHDEALQQTVGFVWFAIVDAAGVRSGFVYHILIQPAFRGLGHAKAALDRVEAIAAAEGLATLSLHVFSFSTGAQALYRSLGYGITGFNMLKPVRRAGA